MEHLDSHPGRKTRVTSLLGPRIFIRSSSVLKQASLFFTQFIRALRDYDRWLISTKQRTLHRNVGSSFSLLSINSIILLKWWLKAFTMRPILESHCEGQKRGPESDRRLQSCTAVEESDGGAGGSPQSGSSGVRATWKNTVCEYLQRMASRLPVC